jgi:hypothetical protein
MSLLLLPIELVEEILTLCAASRAYRAIAAMSQTCQQFYLLVYKTPDSHLWREIFLTTFDDSMKVSIILASICVKAAACPLLQGQVDWQKEFIDRMAARKYFSRSSALASDAVERDHSVSAICSYRFFSGRQLCTGWQ